MSKVSPEEEERLLSAVKAATEAAEQLRAQADAASGQRRDAVQAAMDAGIQRDAIAQAAGVHRNVLYQIIKRDTP